jgi:DNA replication and repair protein RecF
LQIRHLKTQDFRNLSALDIRFHPRLNFIVGANGSGKTSLLEAVYFLAHGRSFRSSQLNRLIGHDKAEFGLFGQFESAQGKMVLGVKRTQQGEARIRLDGNNLTSHLEVTKQLPVILFNPEQFSLLISNAKARRQLLDWGLFYHDPQFLKAWQDLRKGLKQRNAALKQKAPQKMVQLWDPALVKAAEQLDVHRTQYVNLLLISLQQIVGAFLHDHQVELTYYRGWPKDQALADVLTHHFEQDRKIGHTQYGPQRADLRVKVNGLPASEVLSRGQQKLLICSLKIAQGLLLQEHTNHVPIFLLDDIVSEFDVQNATKIFQQLLLLEAQLLVSVIDPILLPECARQAEYQQIQVSSLVNHAKIIRH